MKLCNVYRDGTRTPSDISKGPPALKILVDTLKPAVRIVSAERQGDGIVVRWEIQEDHPDLGSLKLEYSSAEDATHQWYTVPVDPTLNGSARFRFVGSGAVSVRPLNRIRRAVRPSSARPRVRRRGRAARSRRRRGTASTSRPRAWRC